MASITSALPRVVVRASSAGRTRVQQQRTGGPGRSGAAAKTVKSSTFLGTTSSSSARSVRCNLSMDEADDTTDKTLNSLDAILQGSTDEPEYDGPDKVRDDRGEGEGRRSGHDGHAPVNHDCSPHPPFLSQVKN